MQLTNGISNDLQKLLKYFSGTSIFVIFTKLFPSTASDVFSTRAALYLNDLELLLVKSAWRNFRIRRRKNEWSDNENCERGNEYRYTGGRFGSNRSR